MSEGLRLQKLHGHSNDPVAVLERRGGSGLHKLHGLGNDFLVALVERFPPEADGSRAAAELCRRRRGIGADGLIFAVLDPGGEGTAPGAAMRLWNSDGSPAEVSGNGLRCLAHAIARSRGTDRLDIVIDTLAGPRKCSIRPQRGREAALGDLTVPQRVVGTVEMGEPEPGPLPDGPPADVIEVVRGHVGPGGVERWQTVRVGNPHVVLAVADPAAVDLHEAGPAVESLFSGGINVHFAAVTGVDEITLSVWERGAGVTEACGSGAVAAAAAFRAWGAVSHVVSVRMAGGEARVDLSSPATLTGESTYVAAITVGDG